MKVCAIIWQKIWWTNCVCAHALKHAQMCGIDVSVKTAEKAEVEVSCSVKK